jgi:hypothetical protein
VAAAVGVEERARSSELAAARRPVEAEPEHELRRVRGLDQVAPWAGGSGSGSGSGSEVVNVGTLVVFSTKPRV